MATWFDEVKARHETLSTHAPRTAVEAVDDSGTVVLEGELGPVGAWDALDQEGIEWIVNAHGDQALLIAEIERLRANYAVAVEEVSWLIQNYGRTVSPELQRSLESILVKMAGLT